MNAKAVHECWEEEIANALNEGGWQAHGQGAEGLARPVFGEPQFFQSALGNMGPECRKLVCLRVCRGGKTLKEVAELEGYGDTSKANRRLMRCYSRIGGMLRDWWN